MCPSLSTIPLHSAFLSRASSPLYRVRTPLLCRRLHVTNSPQARGKGPIIYKNSLEKTLEAHRSSNRASVIRKVVSRGDVDQERQAVPPSSVKSAPKIESPAQTAPSTPSPRPVRKDKAFPARFAPRPQVQWRTDEESGRPAQTPWLDYMDAGRKWSNGTARLHAEIRALESYLTPTPLEQETVDQIAKDVASLLRDTVPQPPEVVGSRRTGLAMTHSGLDFIIPVPDPARSIDSIRKPSATRPQVLDAYTDILRTVQGTLRKSPWFDDHVYLGDKHGSIVTGVHVPTGIPVRFSCGEGLPSSIEYIQDYLAEYPSARPLYMTVRLILEIRGLFGSYESSLQSDCLLMLLVASLKMSHGRFRAPDSLGEQLLTTLKLYGTEVDLTTTGVSLDPPSFFTAESVKQSIQAAGSDDLPAYLRGQRALINKKKRAAARHNQPAAARLCLQDPTNYMNDLGRRFHRPRQMQQTFARAEHGLRLSLRAWEDGDRGPDSSILGGTLRANFDDFEDLRARLSSP
ncbi:hypothetical protein BDW42DRAFT_161595 [Aspergillus taichungensis]|uniref:Polynucleotide adenylyltransferase n=1 Tax=Aspergillus taichungensis TaxID=482145 RepID=A0A2J5I563_9EURO|nr:hypothetical protein BDW42DRAFT_161595 [Aspergillus taichungensis]